MFIPRDRLTISNSRSRGPGGQGVNKTESKVEVRFNVNDADWLSHYVRSRLKLLFANRFTREGDFVLSCEEHRSREQNQAACLARLSDMLDEAAIVPKVRRKTKPTKSSQRKRVDSKKLHSRLKQSRRHKEE